MIRKIALVAGLTLASAAAHAQGLGGFMQGFLAGQQAGQALMYGYQPQYPYAPPPVYWQTPSEAYQRPTHCTVHRYYNGMQQLDCY